MRLAWNFDPIEVGEEDLFVFDFTADVGPATVTATNWTCSLAPGQAASFDATPQSHILSTSALTQIEKRSRVTGLLESVAGAFSAAVVGGFAAQNQGAWYVLEAFVTLSDGRDLSLNALVQCRAPGV